jgi:hypothetical protein
VRKGIKKVIHRGAAKRERPKEINQSKNLVCERVLFLFACPSSFMFYVFARAHPNLTTAVRSASCVPRSNTHLAKSPFRRGSTRRCGYPLHFVRAYPSQCPRIVHNTFSRMSSTKTCHTPRPRQTCRFLQAHMQKYNCMHRL